MTRGFEKTVACGGLNDSHFPNATTTTTYQPSHLDLSTHHFTMFSRVLKTTNTQPPSSTPTRDPTPPDVPSKTRSGHVKAQSTAVPPSPSKIPIPTNPTTRSAFVSPPSKENNPERSNYLSFLFPNSNNNSSATTTGAGSGVSTPVKVNNKVTQSSNPTTAYAYDRQQIRQQEAVPATRQGYGNHLLSPENEDVHMQTMKNTVNPAMLKELLHLPAPVATRAPPPLPMRNMHMEDIHMKTQRADGRTERERGVLQPWERELLDSQEVRRKATVAQICKYYRSLGSIIS